MQNHIDRDRFIKINFENIQRGMQSQFEKVNSVSFGNFGTPYDRKYFNVFG